MRTEHVLDVSRLAGIVTYEPAELVVTARPGDPLAAVAAELEAERADAGLRAAGLAGAARQLGRADARRRVACNLAGPRRRARRIGARLLLGFSAVNGFGEAWKAGGKVVKNVTGYDMAKLQAGAYGTLSVLTEITLETTPKPETACTLALRTRQRDGDPDAGAGAELAVRGLGRRPPARRRARRSGGGAVASGCGGHASAARGAARRPSPIAPTRSRALIGRGARLDDAETSRPSGGSSARSGRSSARAPDRLAPVPDAERGRGGRARLPRGLRLGRGSVRLGRRAPVAEPRGGRSRAATAARPPSGPRSSAAGGHATLVAAPEAMRASDPVFEPEEGALARPVARG